MPSQQRGPFDIEIYGTTAANLGIAVTQFIVAAITRISAMASAGMHFAADTFKGLLLLGQKLSRRPATPEHRSATARRCTSGA